LSLFDWKQMCCTTSTAYCCPWHVLKNASQIATNLPHMVEVKITKAVWFK